MQNPFTPLPSLGGVLLLPMGRIAPVKVPTAPFHLDGTLQPIGHTPSGSGDPGALQSWEPPFSHITWHPPVSPRAPPSIKYPWEDDCMWETSYPAIPPARYPFGHPWSPSYLFCLCKYISAVAACSFKPVTNNIFRKNANKK